MIHFSVNKNKNIENVYKYAILIRLFHVSNSSYDESINCIP